MNMMKSRLITNKRERIIFMSNASIISNCLIALGKLAMGIYNNSIFLCINAFYNLGMAFAKIVVLYHYKNDDQKNVCDCYKQVGIILICTAVTYIFYSCRLFISHEITNYSMFSGIAIATVTFFEIGFAMYGILTNTKEQAPIVNSIKIINLCSSLISLVLTQTALLSFNSAIEASQYNGILALIFGSSVIFLGIYMIKYSKKRY